MVFDLAQIEGFGEIGATPEEMGAVLGCSDQTIRNRLADNEEFRLAYERGSANDKMSLRRLIKKQTEGFTYKENVVTKDGEIVEVEKYAKPDTVAQIWRSKNLLGWSDKSIIENVPKMSTEDLARGLAEAIAQGAVPTAVLRELARVPEIAAMLAKLGQVQLPASTSRTVQGRRVKDDDG